MNYKGLAKNNPLPRKPVPRDTSEGSPKDLKGSGASLPKIDKNLAKGK